MTTKSDRPATQYGPAAADLCDRCLPDRPRMCEEFERLQSEKRVGPLPDAERETLKAAHTYLGHCEGCDYGITMEGPTLVGEKSPPDEFEASCPRCDNGNSVLFQLERETKLVCTCRHDSGCSSDCAVHPPAATPPALDATKPLYGAPAMASAKEEA